MLKAVKRYFIVPNLNLPLLGSHLDILRYQMVLTLCVDMFEQGQNLLFLIVNEFIVVD